MKTNVTLVEIAALVFGSCDSNVFFSSSAVDAETTLLHLNKDLREERVLERFWRSLYVRSRFASHFLRVSGRDTRAASEFAVRGKRRGALRAACPFVKAAPLVILWE